ncbi:unnamed protein product [Lactuca saligna]|uniref:Ubiquitin-like protease family profile domain-containing protein n=1 Tax=Lactuca saligna TaxID=75948 RepID=A0AA36EHZ1_LACSI|nr:unnamed protein product [Lactuca saligna]
MERRPTNSRWTIYPQEINLQLRKRFLFRHVTNGVGGRPKYKEVNMVLFPINVVATHWFMTVLHLDTWKVDIYDLTRFMNFFSKYLSGGEFKSFGDSIISELDVIEYWNNFRVGDKDKATMEFIDIVDAPQHEYTLDRGDCGVIVCMFMEMIVSGVLVKIDNVEMRDFSTEIG